MNTDVATCYQEQIRSRLHWSIEQFGAVLVAVSLGTLAYEYWFFCWCKKQAMTQAPSAGTYILQQLRQWADNVGLGRQLERVVFAITMVWTAIKMILSALVEEFRHWRDSPRFKRQGYPSLALMTVFGARAVAVGLQVTTAKLPGGLLLIGACSAVRVLALLYAWVFVVTYLGAKTLFAVALIVLLVMIRSRRKSRRGRR